MLCSGVSRSQDPEETDEDVGAFGRDPARLLLWEGGGVKTISDVGPEEKVKLNSGDEYLILYTYLVLLQFWSRMVHERNLEWTGRPGL